MPAFKNERFALAKKEFYSRGRGEYPAPWGGIRVFNPDCNTF